MQSLIALSPHFRRNPINIDGRETQTRPLLFSWLGLGNPSILSTMPKKYSIPQRVDNKLKLWFVHLLCTYNLANYNLQCRLYRVILGFILLPKYLIELTSFGVLQSSLGVFTGFCHKVAYIIRWYFGVASCVTFNNYLKEACSNTSTTWDQHAVDVSSFRKHCRCSILESM